MRRVGMTAAVLLGMWIMADDVLSGQDLNRFTRTVTVNGLAFPVLDYGEGSPVLLLHGFPDDRFLWRNQVKELPTAGLRVIAPDLRGFGDAPRPADPAEYGLDIAARDVIGILDALRIRAGDEAVELPVVLHRERDALLVREAPEDLRGDRAPQVRVQLGEPVHRPSLRVDVHVRPERNSPHQVAQVGLVGVKAAVRDRLAPGRRGGAVDREPVAAGPALR